MSKRLCSNGWIRTYIEYTQNLESPELFHKWSAISVIACALGRSVRFGDDYFCLRPNLYVVLVGPTGKVKKSTALNFAFSLLRRALPNIRIVQGKITMQKIFREMQEEYNLTGNSQIIIQASEFKVFTSGTGSSSSLLEDMTDLWDCRDEFDYMTKTQGTFKLYNVCVNLAAASVPEWLTIASSQDFINSGFSSRIIYVNKEKSERSIAIPRKPPHGEILERNLMHDLVRISELEGTYVMTPDAAEFFESWYPTTKQLDDVDERMHGYMDRKATYVIKLAMILQASLSDALVIEKHRLQEAIALLEEVEDSMLGAYKAVGQYELGTLMDRIMIQLMNSPDGSLTKSELLKKNYRNISKGASLDEALASLESMGRVVHEVIPPKKGHKPTMRWRVVV